MGRRAKPTPTDAELEILKVLWELNVCTVRDVHDHLSESRTISYASVSKMISLMIRKGFVDVIDPRRPQRIRAAHDRKTTIESMIAHFKNAVFGGSLKEMINHLMGSIGSADEVGRARQAVDAAKARKTSKATKPGNPAS